MVVLGHGALALKHLNEHGGLVVLVGGEGLGLLGGDDGVAVDELGHHSAHGLNAQGQGGHIQQQQVVGGLGRLAGKDAALHRRAVRHGLVGVHAVVELLAVEEILQQRAHLHVE